MKGSRKTAEDEPAIAATTVVRGELAGEEDLTILGRFEGSIELGKAALRIERSAVVRADVRAGTIRIAGVLVGSAVAMERIHLLATARVAGDLRAARVVIDPGAQLSGAVDATPDRTRERPLPQIDLPTRLDPSFTQPEVEATPEPLEAYATTFDARGEEPPREPGAERRRRLVVKVRRRGP